jgi:predicted dehydrogenase
MKSKINRRKFVQKTGLLTAGSLFLNAPNLVGTTNKLKLAMVGTGIRGISFWGKAVLDNFSQQVEFIGLCDINPGRVAVAKQYLQANCPTYTDFDKMLTEIKPDYLIVTTVDSTHDYFIIKALEKGINVITEKPMTTDEVKCKKILAAEKKSGKKVIVGFNYRYGLQFTKIKELLHQKRVGEVTSVDFHWYLNVYHGADYFRRWHRLKAKGGTLLVHKATHHFDLLNWWLDSDPVEVFAWGKLEHYGKNNAFRHTHCRTCPYQQKCKFYWDITKSPELMALYVANEQHDGYLRDGCVWKEDIDIYDKMSVQIKYANDVVVNYSLTAYSPYEGFRIAFNGKNGRMDAWEGIPWQSGKYDQATLHQLEMSQKTEIEAEYDEIMLMDNFGEYESVKIPRVKSGHGGGDKLLHEKIFLNPQTPDPLKHTAGTRDGAMSILIGIAARQSIETGKVIKIADLTDIALKAQRP